MDLDSTANAQICDPKTLLHWNHIRQGNSQSWRSLANPRQRRMMARLCGRWLTSRGYPADSDKPAAASVSAGDMLRSEVDLMVGRATFLIRNTSSRYPRTARAIKRVLGMRIDAPARPPGQTPRRHIPRHGYLASPISGSRIDPTTASTACGREKSERHRDEARPITNSRHQTVIPDRKPPSPNSRPDHSGDAIRCTLSSELHSGGKLESGLFA